MSVNRLITLIKERDTRKRLIENYLNEICQEIDDNGGLRNYEQTHANDLAEVIRNTTEYINKL
jgi:hypothetical protein